MAVDAPPRMAVVAPPRRRNAPPSPRSNKARARRCTERSGHGTHGRLHRRIRPPLFPARLCTLLRAVRKMCPRSHGLQMATGRDVRQLTDHDVTQEQPDQALERGMWRGDEI
jgi:hypothetical protein